MANSTTEADPARRAMRREVGMGERRRFVRAHVSPEMERFLAGQQPGRPSWSGPMSGEGVTMREDRTGADDHVRADEPTGAGSPQPAINLADTRGQSPHA